MTDRAWFDAAKGDIPQWAASMPKDADGTTIDWDWVRSLDLAHGVGTIPESTPQSIHDALKADYATRECLESIIAQCNSAFMTDFDRLIGSYRLPRALAYANRRLNDNINTMLHLGEQQHLWAVSRERRGRATIAGSERRSRWRICRKYCRRKQRCQVPHNSRLGRYPRSYGGDS